MGKFTHFILDFVCIFLVVFIIYSVFINKRKSDFNKLKSNDVIRLFVLRYDLDYRKIDYPKLVKVMSLISSFIIAFTSALIINIDSFIWSILVCFITVTILTYALFEIASKFFKNNDNIKLIKKKGDKNE